MIGLTDAFALLGWALLVCAVSSRLQPLRSVNSLVLKGLLFATFTAFLIPVFGGAYLSMWVITPTQTA